MKIAAALLLLLAVVSSAEAQFRQGPGNVLYSDCGSGYPQSVYKRFDHNGDAWNVTIGCSNVTAVQTRAFKYDPDITPIIAEVNARAPKMSRDFGLGFGWWMLLHFLAIAAANVAMFLIAWTPEPGNRIEKKAHDIASGTSSLLSVALFFGATENPQIILPTVAIGFLIVALVLVARLDSLTRPGRLRRAEARRLAKLEARRLKDLRDVPAYPTVDQFQKEVTDSYYASAGDTVLVPQSFSLISAAIGSIYETDFTPPKQLPSADDPQRLYRLFKDVMVEGLLAFTAQAPNAIKQPRHLPNSLFSEVRTLDGCFFQDGVLDPQARSALQGFASTWKRASGLHQYFPYGYDEYTGIEPPIRQQSVDPKEDRQYAREFEKAQKEYESKAKERRKETPVVQQLLAGTPFYYHADLFMPRGEKKVPFVIDPAHRFRHQFVVGATGSGKTTFLSAQIKEDLKAVWRDEASLFVMDSQNELIPSIAALKEFGPGGPMEGKLIYLEPDPEYPLALNIFDFNKERIAGLSPRDRVTLMRGTEEMVSFFLESLVRAETSGFMDAIIKYALRATALVPNATVFTFKDFLYKDGFKKYEHYLGALSENDRRFLTSDMFDGSYGASLGAMRSRFAAFTADELFNQMFSQPHNKFDLFKELQSSKVILVNTMGGMLKDAAEPFGRFFIAKLLQATEERMLIRGGRKVPVYAYIDEAQDYIKDERNIRELIEKARKQNVSLTIATHEIEDLDTTVANALLKAAIQCRGREWPLWSISVLGGEPVNVLVPDVNFAKMPAVTSDQYQAMVADMRARYSCGKSEPPVELEAEMKQLLQASPIRRTARQPDDDFPTGPSTSY